MAVRKMPKPSMPEPLGAAGFVKSSHGPMLPSEIRLKNFPVTPKLPASLGAPGETSQDQFEARYMAMRAGRYPVITRPELKVMEWLQQHFGPASEGHDWDYQVTLQAFTGIQGQVDFIVWSSGSGRGAVWQVQGTHFHYGDPTKEAADQVLKSILMQNDFEVIALLDTQIMADVDEVCEAALRGEQLYVEPQLGGRLPGAPPNYGSGQ